MTDTTLSTDEMVRAYIRCRDKLKEIDEKCKLEKEPLLNLQQELVGKLTAFLEQSGSEAVRTEHGSCYLSTKYTASLADPDAFMRYVIEQKEFDLLDRRANSTAVKAFVEAQGSLPPGVNLNAIQTLGVRRANGKD